MLLKTLVENTSLSSEFENRHGLSFYLETGTHRMLFDLGQDELFLENARKMDVDIDSVDTVIISHGHYDHGGGLKTFLKQNSQAKVFIRENAFEPHFSHSPAGYKENGLDPALKKESQLIFTDEVQEIDTGLVVFSNVSPKELFSGANKNLYREENHKKISDDFSHEQNLIICEGEKRILIAGCSHAGIINIKKKAENILGTNVTHVIAGFHLYNPSLKKSESDAFIHAVGSRLREEKVMCYTCHCTGAHAYSLLAENLGENITYLATGSCLEI